MTQNTQGNTPRSALRLPRFRFGINPIVIKEMRAQMRGSRAFWTLTGFLVTLGLLTFGLYRAILNGSQGQFGPNGPPQSAFIGQSLFVGLALLEMLLVCFLTPALTAGTISGEIERRTYDTLLSTPMRPWSILWGKTMTSLIYVQLLILAAIPLSSIVFLFGGVVLRDMLQVVGLLMITATTYGTLGLFFSALTRRTGRATILSYTVVFVFSFGSLLVWWVIQNVGGRVPPYQILYLNPLSALISAVVTPPKGDYYVHRSAIDLFTNLGGGPNVLGFYSGQAPPRPIWQYTMALYSSGTIVLYLLTTCLVKPVRRWQIGWRAALVLLFVLLALAGGLWFVFRTNRGSTGFQPPTATEIWVEQNDVMVMPDMPPTPILTTTPLEFDSPIPRPTRTPPPPTPVPLDAEMSKDDIQNHIEQNLMPGNGILFCDVQILTSHSEWGHAQVFAWVYCQTFQVAADADDVTPGITISAPIWVDMRLSESRWQVGGYWFSDSLDLSAPEIQHLLQNPYDQAAGQARLLERARQALLGD